MGDVGGYPQNLFLRPTNATSTAVSFWFGVISGSTQGLLPWFSTQGSLLEVLSGPFEVPEIELGVVTCKVIN